MNDRTKVNFRFVSQPMCVCGHTEEAHTHLRRGSDCGACDCKRFRAVGSLDPTVLGVWLGLLLASLSVLALIVWGAVSFVRWLF